MQTNWSLILNVFLLFGVLVTIGLLMKAKRQNAAGESRQPNLGAKEKNQALEAPSFNDDIIAVRKVTQDNHASSEYETAKYLHKKQAPRVVPQLFTQEPVAEVSVQKEPVCQAVALEEQARLKPEPSSLMMFLLAKENRVFAGYELLQTVLATGLRFGEGHLFHRHQHANGQGPVLCSLAAATQTGVFDLQNIGGFSVRGLCLFMHASQNPGIDKERFAIMLETAQQLKEGLDAHLLDSQKKPLTEERIAGYWNTLQVQAPQLDTLSA